MKLASILMITILISCGGNSLTVQRIDSNKVTDISGKWNDTDSRSVAKTMITDVLSHPWLSNFQSMKKENPVLIAGKIRNKTSEHVDTDIFVKDIEKELLRSGRVFFVASKNERKDVREERTDQQSNSSMDTAKELANETGADYMLQGHISSQVDPKEGEKVIFYQIYLELVDIEKNLKIWNNTHEIKKYISQSGYKL
jgi:penicillin-binding protein activator